MKKLLLTTVLSLAFLGQSFASFPCEEELKQAEALEKTFADWAKTHLTGDGFDAFDSEVEPLLENSIIKSITEANIPTAEASKLHDQGKLKFMENAPGSYRGAWMNDNYAGYAKDYCSKILTARKKEIADVAQKTGKAINFSN